jgi:hypothetical protein
MASHNNITFGLEYELKLRLTKSQIQEEISSDSSSKHIQVVTDPGQVRLSNVGPQYLKNNYLNFAFHDSHSHPQRTTLVNKTTGDECDFRGYSTEALRIMQNATPSHPWLPNNQHLPGKRKAIRLFISASTSYPRRKSERPHEKCQNRDWPLHSFRRRHHRLCRYRNCHSAPHIVSRGL